MVELTGEGAVRAVGPADERYEPTDAQIAFHLAEFVKNTRSISIDPVVVRQNWLMAYAYAADRARRLVASPRAMRWINRTTGGVMAGAAAAIATRS